MDIFLSVGDRGLCEEHGCELETEVIMVRNLATGDEVPEAILFCPECQAEIEAEPRGVKVPEILNLSDAVCPLHHCYYTYEVGIEDYDPELDAAVPGVGYSCPICVDEYEAAHPKPQPASVPDIPF